MEAKEAWENLQLKFKSGNDIPVRQAKITKEEYEAIKETTNSGYPLLGEVTWKNKRIEIIDDDGRQYVRYNVDIEVSLQDNDRTIKIFVKRRPDIPDFA